MTLNISRAASLVVMAVTAFILSGCLGGGDRCKERDVFAGGAGYYKCVR